MGKAIEPSRKAIKAIGLHHPENSPQRNQPAEVHVLGLGEVGKGQGTNPMTLVAFLECSVAFPTLLIGFVGFLEVCALLEQKPRGKANESNQGMGKALEPSRKAIKAIG